MRRKAKVLINRRANVPSELDQFAASDAGTIAPERSDTNHRKHAYAVLFAIALACLALMGLRGTPSAGAESVFPGQGTLPDNRAYELVSPPDKNGGEVSASSLRTRVAADGSAIQFLSQTAFSGANGSGPYGVEYMAVRDSENWQSHSITPPAGAPTFPGIDNTNQYQGNLSPDFESGFFLSVNPVTNEDPNVANVSNLYYRTNLKTPGDGNYKLVSACPACTGPLPTETFFAGGRGLAYAGASADFSHVIFESMDNLTSDATGPDPKVYEWLPESDHLRLAGILPDNDCGSPPCAAAISYAGNSAGGGGAGGSSGGAGGNSAAKYPLSRNAISQDGSRIFFTGPPIKKQGRAFFGELYVREGGTSTVPINVSERSTPDPYGHKPATFQGASADGRYVLFISSEALTDDGPQNLAGLYRADLSKPPGQRLEFISGDAEGRPDALVGMSQDGHYVYFSTAGSADDALYVWHEGDTRRIAAHRFGDFALGGEGGGEIHPDGDNFRLLDDGTQAVFVSAEPTTALETAGYDNTSGDASDSDRCGRSGFSESYCGQIYVYDYASDALSCASCNLEGGSLPNAPALFQFSIRSGPGEWPNYQNHPLTADGSKVFFATTEALVPKDRNGQYDVYQYDVESGSRSLISTGQDSRGSYFLDASADGSDIVFATGESLVGVDVDDEFDLYDARVNGGLESQNPPPAPPGCIGDECQGPAGGPPASDPPGTESHDGSGNVDGSKARSCRRRADQVGRLEKRVERLRRRARRAHGQRTKRLRRKAKLSRKRLLGARASVRSCRRTM